MDIFKKDYKTKKGKSVNFVKIDEAGISYRISNEDYCSTDYKYIYYNIKNHLSKKSLWYKILILFIILFAIIMSVLGIGNGDFMPNIVMPIFGVAWWLSIPFLLLLDKKRKTAYLIYDIVSQRETVISKFYDIFFDLKKSEALWAITGVDSHEDGRRHSGATSSVKRKNIEILNTPIKRMQTNIFIPVISIEKQNYYFFPDKIYYIHNGLRVIDYKNINITISTSQFRESGTIPSDSEKIGSTWKYVNNDGSPDKRFNDNCKIPILKYCSIILTDKSDFNLTIMVSNFEIGKSFANALSEYKLGYKG
jgi:hypothetical protein